MRELHKVHLVREFKKDDRFETVKFRLAEPREPGSYRVIGHTKTHWFLDDPSYPATDARIEVGFKNGQDDEYYWYWFNWIEPEKSFMLGWHRDGDHPKHGPVHRQINQGESVVDRESAAVIDAHPGAIFHTRLEQLPHVLGEVEWDNDRAIGFQN